MRGVNRLILVGRVGRDPELRHGRNGTAWCNLSVATDRATRSDDGWSTVTDWHRVKVFGRTAEFCHQRVGRGCLVSVEGPLTYDTWQDDTGRKRTVSVVLAERLQLLAGPGAAVGRPATPAEPPASQATPVVAQA